MSSTYSPGCIITFEFQDPRTIVFIDMQCEFAYQEEFTGTYAGLLEEHFLKIRGQETNSFNELIHRGNALPTVLCIGKSSESFWLGCPTRSEKFIQLFIVCLVRDDTAL